MGCGVCRRCNQIACLSHLRHGVDKNDFIDKDGERLVCQACVTRGEKIEDITTWRWRLRRSRGLNQRPRPPRELASSGVNIETAKHHYRTQPTDPMAQSKH
jgi:hypothetical protein